MKSVNAKNKTGKPGGKIKSLAGVLIVTDLDGTVGPNDTIFDLFEIFGKRERAIELDKQTPSSDIQLVFDEIARAKPLPARVFNRVANNAKLFKGVKPFFARLQNAGATIVVLTATYTPIAQRLAQRLRLGTPGKPPVILSTRVRQRTRGRSTVATGFAGPLMEDAYKATALRALVTQNARNGWTLSRAVGLADSTLDKPFMNAITNAGGLEVWVDKKQPPNFQKIYQTIQNKFQSRIEAKKTI